MYALHCGDCLELMRELPDKSIDAIITDPPWNVGKDYGTYKDNLTREEYSEWIRKLKSEWDRVGKNGKVCIVLGSEILKQWWDEYPNAKIVIVKLGAIVLTQKNKMHLQWKPILTTCVSNEFATDLWEDIRWPGEGYYFNEPRYGHPAMTPLKLMKRLVARFTDEGDTILEPFAGVGTTGVACVELNRNFIGIEINPEYFAIAERRIKEAAAQLTLFANTPPNPSLQLTAFGPANPRGSYRDGGN